MLEDIKNLLAENSGLSGVFQRNLVKEYLQTLALAFLYSRKEYSGLIFYGGSALKHCHGLPRRAAAAGRRRRQGRHTGED